MRTLIAIFISIAATAAFAFDPGQEGSGDAFAQCSGYHHGSYLDFYSNQDGTKIAIEVSGDGDLQPGEEWPLYQVTKVQKDSQDVKSADFNQTFVDVIKDIENPPADAFNGFVYVEAQGPDGSVMQLNLNNYFGHSYLVIDGFVEPLQCSIYQH